MVSFINVQSAFFWNISANVGRGQPNREDDVELCRFGYLAFKNNTKVSSRMSPELLASIARMRTMGPFDNDLHEVIVLHQRQRGGTQDGIVSVAKPNIAPSGEYDGSHLWIVLAMNESMREIMPEEYPRIDKHQQSGAAISSAVKRILLRRPF